MRGQRQVFGSSAEDLAQMRTRKVFGLQVGGPKHLERVRILATSGHVALEAECVFMYGQFTLCWPLRTWRCSVRPIRKE